MASEDELKAEVERLRAENEALKRPIAEPRPLVASEKRGSPVDSRVLLRASIKTIQLGYALSLLLAIGITGYLLAIQNQDDRMWAVLAIPALFAVFALIGHLQRRFTSLTILSDRLRYESGLLSKTTRTLELAKVQDIRVDQTFAQRILNIGDLSLETAGGASRLVMPAIDRPQDAADHILELSRASHSGAGQPLR
jgi:uncharacterized membrane protein YdbT with pleckstrin-like domain